MAPMTTIENPGRGEQTRQAMITAAIDEFGRTGFDAATTRALSDAAGVNQALIGYHFGGKSGLYLAVFEHIVSQMQAHMLPVVEQTLAALDTLPTEDSARREAALKLLLTLFNAFIDMHSAETARSWVPLVLREQQKPTAAFDLIYEKLIGRMLDLLTHLVALASGMDEDSDACRVRTLMILGQVLVFQVARSGTARHLSWDALSPENIAAIKEQLRLSVESQFSQRAPQP